MAELADALDSKSCIFGCAGSTPALGTIFSLTNREAFYDLLVFKRILGA